MSRVTCPKSIRWKPLKSIEAQPWKRILFQYGDYVKVLIPSPLYSYTQQKNVEAVGETLAELLNDLERQYPGLRFRMVDEQDQIRAHIRFFINDEQVFDLERKLSKTDTLNIVQALSGG